MDDVDSDILGILAADGRISFRDLGREVGLSANAAAARVRRLEASGVIAGFTVVLSEEAPRAALSLEVFIDVRLDGDSSFDDFANALASVAEVADVVHLTGPYDALVHAFVADTGALDRLVSHLKKNCGAGQTHTRVALRSPARKTRP